MRVLLLFWVGRAVSAAELRARAGRRREWLLLNCTCSCCDDLKCNLKACIVRAAMESIAKAHWEPNNFHGRSRARARGPS